MKTFDSRKMGGITLLGALLAISPVAFSQFVDGAAAEVQTVAVAKKMKDDAWVVLEGHIVKQIRGEQYLFRDASGEIEVEIDHDKWNGQAVKPDTKVRITGEIDQDLLSTELEVDRIEIIGAEGPKAGGFSAS